MPYAPYHLFISVIIEPLSTIIGNAQSGSGYVICFFVPTVLLNIQRIVITIYEGKFEKPLKVNQNTIFLVT